MLHELAILGKNRTALIKRNAILALNLVVGWIAERRPKIVKPVICSAIRTATSLTERALLSVTKGVTYSVNYHGWVGSHP